VTVPRQAFFRRVTGSGPAVLALEALRLKRPVGAIEKAALAAAFYRLTRQLAPPDVRDTQVSRVWLPSMSI
jgi:hypothetical protein